MIIASGLAVAMKPTQKLADHKAKFGLETLIPKQFGVWRIDGTLVPVIADPKVSVHPPGSVGVSPAEMAAKMAALPGKSGGSERLPKLQHFQHQRVTW